jgi:electron transfer flavoprotein alpha subunit
MRIAVLVELEAAYPVDEVLSVDVPRTHFEAALWAAAAEALIDELNPSLVLCGHTVDSMGFAPRLAATKGLGFEAEIVGLEWTDGLRVRRLTYGQKLVAQLEFPERRCVLVTVRPGIFGMPPPATRQHGYANSQWTVTKASHDTCELRRVTQR